MGGYMVLKGWFKNPSEAVDCLFNWSERIKTDYMAEYCYIRPLVYINVKTGEFEKYSQKGESDLSHFCTVDGINKYFNERYGTNAIRAAFKRMRELMAKGQYDFADTREIKALGELIGKGGNFLAQDIDVREHEYNEWCLDGTWHDIRDSIVNISEAFADEIDGSYADNDHLHLLVVDVQD